MEHAGETLAGPLTVVPFTGGRSNLTYRLDDGLSSWVLRTPPRQGRTLSAHDVAREFSVMRALKRTEVPVPHPVLLCEDASILGVPFAITRFVHGVAIQSRAEIDTLTERALSAAVGALLDALAAVHAVDHTAVGLAGFGRPGKYADRQVRRWTHQWDQVGLSELAPLATDLAARLAAIDFRQDHVGIVHGDYRIDNTLLHLAEGEERVEAIIDWELSTIGDPTADIALMCAYRHPALDLVLGQPSAWTSIRLPAPESLAATYERLSGKTLHQWNEHMALAYFKLAVIAAGIDYRYRSGATRGAGFDSAAAAVPVLLEAGMERVQGKAN